MVPLEERFWPKVDRRGYGECWPWLAATVKHPHGEYGKIYVAGKLQPAHRVAFFLVHGRWPEPFGLHGCDNPLCCNAENPEHVHEGTPKDNTREMFERGRGVLPPVHAGERASRSRLTDEQALEIITRYRAGGVSQAVLAADYGVAQPSISVIVRGKRRSLQ